MRRFLSAYLLLMLLFSCGERTETIHVLTDRKELAIAAQVFDASHDDVIITLRHVPAIDARMIAEEMPDLIVGAHLAAPEITALLQPLHPSESIYTAIKIPQDSRDRPLLAPLSFELPIIMGLRETLSTLPDPIVVKPEDLRTAAKELSAHSRNGRLLRQGFSPLWNPESFTDFLAIRQPENMNANLTALGAAALLPVIEEIREWRTEIAGSLEADEDFTTRYRYLPDEYLLLQERIFFARANFDSWAALPGSTAQKLGFRYFSGNRHIPVVSVTWAGIPSESSSPKAAARFTAWLENGETQAMLMNRWQQSGLRVFGYFGGLSAVPEVNESILVRHFPEVSVPENHYFFFPPTVPHRWTRIKGEVIAPWFSAAVAGDKVELPEAIARWDLSSLSESEE